LALTPVGANKEISDVERACVTQLHHLAAPLPPDELLRRRTAGLSLAKDSMLLKWGYPHVLDYFRFHLSLTGPLRDCSELQIQSLIDFASENFSPYRFANLILLLSLLSLSVVQILFYSSTVCFLVNKFVRH